MREIRIVQTVKYYVERRPLLRYEKHRLSARYHFRDQIRNRLALSCPWRPTDHAVLFAQRGCNGLLLRGVGVANQKLLFWRLTIKRRRFDGCAITACHVGRLPVAGDARHDVVSGEGL